MAPQAEDTSNLIGNNTLSDANEERPKAGSLELQSKTEDGQDVTILGVDVPEKGGFWWKLLAYLGPGFLMSIAYLDPANFQSDLAAGGQYGYELLWVLLLASFFGLLIQTLSAKLSVVTGKHLAQHCRAEYPKYVNLALWVVAEVSVIAADIPEVIGTATALKLLTGCELWIGVLATGLSTFVFLFIQQFGVRKLEAFIAALVATMGVCFLIEFTQAKPDVGDLFEGMFKPDLSGPGATGIAISLIGANIMPHNLFLHSGLVLSRRIPRTHSAVKDGIFYNNIEISISMLIAYLINVCVIGTSGAVCQRENLTDEQIAVCADMAIGDIPDLLQNTLGSTAPIIFAISLLASGQSSTVTATFAGEYIMQGFLELKFPQWVRNLITRLVALVPSLIVSLLGGQSATTSLIITCSMILSFCLPFDLMPLLKFTGSRVKMGPYANKVWLSAVMWILGVITMGLNIYFILGTLIEWLMNPGGMPAVGVVFISLLAIVLLLGYFASLLYLAFRLDREETYVELQEQQDAAKADLPLLPVSTGGVTASAE